MCAEYGGPAGGRRGRPMFDDAGRPVTAGLDGPATPNQWGRVLREFGRLGLADRGQRLCLTAQLAGRGAADLGSTRDLSAGEAGRVVRVLAGCGTLADAYRLADRPRRARQWARMRARLARQLGERMAAEHG
jgi:hypothetical protein